MQMISIRIRCPASKIMLLFLGTGLLQDASGQTWKAGILVDTTITGFHYATDFGGMAAYTQHGRSDINGAVVKGDGAVLVFTAGDLDKGKFIELFKKTFYKLGF